MKKLIDLKNPDIIEINGDKFQVLVNTTSWYNFDTGEMEMVIELIKVGEKNLLYTHMLFYFEENDLKRRRFFEILHKKRNLPKELFDRLETKEIKIVGLKLSI